MVKSTNTKRLCAFDELPPSMPTRFVVDKHRICVVRIGEDIYAIGDRCSHADYSLSEGELYEDLLEIECWKHGSSFSLKTGEPQSLPATKPVPVYEVRREGDDILVVLP